MSPSLEDVARLHSATGFERLKAAQAEEKKGELLRHANHAEEAIEAYDRARELYADSDFAYHEQGESELAKDVRRSIARCNAIVRNIRDPKPKRAPATTPRPNCLACSKPLRRYRFDGKALKDGTLMEWGAYGDGRFCGLSCGWTWACRNAPMPKLIKEKKQ